MGVTKEDMIERIEMVDYAQARGIDTNCDSTELAWRINEYKLSKVKTIKQFVGTEYDW